MLIKSFAEIIKAFFIYVLPCVLMISFLTNYLIIVNEMTILKRNGGEAEMEQPGSQYW